MTDLESTPRPSPHGYAHPAYAAAVAGANRVQALPAASGSLVARDIPASDRRDLTAPYPIFCCADWGALAGDLRDLGPAFVSAAMVVDPFGGWTESQLRECFPDLLVHFKDHFVVELGEEPLAHLGSHHRRNVARARREVVVDTVRDVVSFTPEWQALYGALVDRHQIRGAAAFSKGSLAAQLTVPGMVALRARADGATVGATLWYVQDDVVYYHLAAYTPAGYVSRASFALFAAALETFAAQGVRWASLGGGAGTEDGDDDGLVRFKRGWSTGTRPAWFGGRVLDRGAYDRLAGPRPARWFPAYRATEPR